MRIALFGCAMLAAALATPLGLAQTDRTGDLRAPAAFADIADEAARSRALFAEIAKVLTSPRCMNCHPAGDHPTQGDDRHPHQPPVERGASGTGIPGAPCTACHMGRTVELYPGSVASFRSIPGHPRWELAPIEMAWQGKTVRDICRQIKDRNRNGGCDLAAGCRSTSPRTTSSPMAGIRAPAARPRPARRRAPANCCRRGSTPAPSVRELALSTRVIASEAKQSLFTCA